MFCSPDHYAGLSDTWRSGIVYCSEVTARLAVAIVQVSPDLLRPLPMNTPQTIQGGLSTSSIISWCRARHHKRVSGWYHTGCNRASCESVACLGAKAQPSQAGLQRSATGVAAHTHTRAPRRGLQERGPLPCRPHAACSAAPWQVLSMGPLIHDPHS